MGLSRTSIQMTGLRACLKTNISITPILPDMRYLTFLFLVLLSVSSNAQGVTSGIRIGGDLASQTFGSEREGQTDWKFGMLAGVSRDQDLGNQLHVLSDLMWIMKGTRSRDDATRTKGLTTLNYLELDLLGKFELSNEKDNGLFLTLGPTFGYFLSGRVKNTQDGVEISNIKVDSKDLDRPFEFGGAAGVGFDLNDWVLEFRGQLGFTSIDSGGQVKNAVISAHFSRYFDLQKAEEEPMEN